MNVLYLQDHGNIGGAQLSLRDLLRALRQCAPEINPFVLLGEEGYLFDELSADGISATIVPFVEFRKWKFFFQRANFKRQLMDICRERKIQIVHANNFQTAPWSAALASAVAARSCCTVREAIGPKVLRKYRVLENDRIIAISEAVARNFPAEAAGALRQIYNCVPAPAPLSPRAAARQKMGLSDGPGLIVGYVGALSERKGLLDLLAAIPAVLRKLPEVQFVLVGDGKRDFVKTLRQRAVALQITDRLHFPGEIKYAANLLAAFDLLVLPSHMEGASRAIIEAMHTGLAVVGTRAGGPTEIIQDGLSGTLVPPADGGALAEAMLRYLQNEPLRRQHGERARGRAAELFSPERNALKVAALYREMLERE